MDSPSLSSKVSTAIGEFSNSSCKQCATFWRLYLLFIVFIMVLMVVLHLTDNKSSWAKFGLDSVQIPLAVAGILLFISCTFFALNPKACSNSFNDTY